ncbi:MAG: hypothetical protein A2Y63_06550 [Candidatus Riflebacteria bacterium RBG_13_59_9]|nr:MAG: hypothetical protein A2Y63_06550 [Candidatus Riflebacteria bacterium RBG_13_59_9]
MRLSVVVPNYNGGRLLPSLVESIREALSQAPYEWELVVADDASTDDSGRIISESFPSVSLVRGRRNLGFGRNCNRGAEVATGEYLAFVNSDIVVGSDVFTPLLARLERSANVFAVMPLVYARSLQRVENLQEVWLCRGLPWLRPVPGMPVEDVSATVEALSREVYSVPLCGAFFVCRREHFKRLGGFAGAFGKAYWEDVDLSYRAHRQGLVTVVAADAVVEHLHSQTMDQVLGERGKRSHLLRNQALFLARNLDLLRPVPWYRLYLLLRLAQRLVNRDWGVIPLYVSQILRIAR